MWKWTKRLSLGALGIVILLSLSGLLYQSVSTKLEKKQYPPTGKMIDIGGYQLHLDCRGSGGPTVILESGQGCYSLDWALVQPALSEFTRVCSYDRAGYGWSDESPKDRSIKSMVVELHTLLQKAEIPPPYILVGHSLGGMNVRLFASLYPSEVAGVVLVDSSHEDQFEKMPELPLPNESLLLWMSRFGLMRILSHTSQYQNAMKMFSNLPKDIQEIRASHSQATKTLKTGLKETHAFEISSKQLQLAGGQLDDKPLIVITAGKTLSSEDTGISQETLDNFQQIFGELQKDLVTKSTHSRQIIAESSDHMIPYHQPEMIIEAVRNVIEESTT